MTSTNNPNDNSGLAQVHYLTSDADRAGEVVEGAVVETPGTALVTQRDKAIARYRGYRDDVVVTGRIIRTAVTHQRTRATGKAVVRHVLYPIAGAGVVLRRWRDTHGASRYERMMQAAEMAGDREALLEWEARDVAEKQARHARVMDWVRSPLDLLKAVAVAVVSVAGLLLVLGIILAVADKELARVLDPIMGVIHLISWCSWFLAAYGALLLTGGTVAGIAYLWAVGRRYTEPPAWVAPSTVADGSEGREIFHDAGSILEALKFLKISGLNDAFKAGWASAGNPMQVWEQEPHRDGKGIRCQIRLPKGASVEDINKKKDLLAHNLVRKNVEVWATEPRNKAAVLDLWIANPGALTGPVPEWPILAKLESFVGNYFESIPVAFNIRGDIVKGRLSEANHAYAGIMGSGKSTLAITMILGAILDPTCEVDVFVMAQNADYEPMRPRLRTLVTGASTDTVKAAMACLRAAYEDLEVRGRALKEHDARANNRQLADKDARLRPQVIVIDECQALYMDENHGEAAADLTVKLVNAARKYGITLLLLTPEPSSASLPRRVMAVMSHKASFATGDQHSNDAVLGTGSYKSGISAVGLKPKTDEDMGDVGTAMTRGFMSEPGLMRCCFNSQEVAHRVTARALEIRAQAGITGGEPIEPVDTLADILAVLGDQERMRTHEVLQKLVEGNRAVYRDWGPEDLSKFLREHDAAPYKSGGIMHVRRARVADAITVRDELVDVDGDEGTVED
ncbi:zonular occludens toxin domain-containing protein [Allokutzneria oryzae]|uniref:Zonular occludens toxin domain-containing protein n=1 Tax=Allokutzneria oryzae TaxID=1378989 RepID=A0ABV5ZZE4_9PSEU